MFRPCVDLHQGKVKQIVGGTLDADTPNQAEINFVSERSAAWHADRYRKDGLLGGHVIKLGPGNDAAAREALAAYPGGLQLGGGVHAGNAADWLDAGASHVIVTSWLFPQGELDRGRLAILERTIGKQRLVLDLSCRKRDDVYWIAINRWQTFANVALTRNLLEELSGQCAEFLVHAADVEGLCRGIDEDLVIQLADWSPLPVTYAGGAKSIDDLKTVTEISRGRVDLTIGSALDIFGGTGVRYRDAVAFNRRTAVGIE